MPGPSGAGVSVIDERGRRSSGSTDARVREADNLQYELDEGPCLKAAATRELVRVDDLTTDRGGRDGLTAPSGSGCARP